MNKTNTAFIISIFLFSINATAQSGTAASGGNATGSNGNVSYTIGQTDYKYANSNEDYVTEGLQQPFDITVVAGIKATNIHLDASVYPNPTANFVTLSFSDPEIQNMSYKVFDVNGKLIQQQNIVKPQTNIAMSGLVNGTYFIKVLNSKTEIKVFKIIKNS